jgi:hypothetical protein
MITLWNFAYTLLNYILNNCEICINTVVVLCAVLFFLFRLSSTIYSENPSIYVCFHLPIIRILTTLKDIKCKILHLKYPEFVSDPCLYKNNVKLPYIATRHPSIRYTSDTHDDRYCDLFALVHGQWYSTFYNMTAYCVEHRSCGTSDPIYLNGN